MRLIACLFVAAACQHPSPITSDANLPGGTSAPLGSACIATDPSTLLACAQTVQAGTTDTIEIRGSLTCTGVDACRVRIVNPALPLTIRGAAGSSIRRLDHHDHPLFSLVGPQQFAITDLVIDESSAVPCDPIAPTPTADQNPACATTLDIFGSAAVAIERVTVAYAKASAVFCNSCRSVRVSNARFIESHLFGLEITGPSALVVEDTLFYRNASNALVIHGAHGRSDAPLYVRRNLFDHNHRLNLYYMCTSDTDPDGGPVHPCSGGQLLLQGEVESLRIEGNVIRNGFSESNPTTNNTGGIEIAPPRMYDISIASNDIHTNDQSAVTANTGDWSPDGGQMSGITVSNNKFYGNGTFYQGANVLNFPPGAEWGTCSTRNCLRVESGRLWTLPGAGVSWTSNDFLSPSLSMSFKGTTTVLSNKPGGTASAPAGALVGLFDTPSLFASPVLIDQGTVR